MRLGLGLGLGLGLEVRPVCGRACWSVVASAGTYAGYHPGPSALHVRATRTGLPRSVRTRGAGQLRVRVRLGSRPRATRCRCCRRARSRSSARRSASTPPPRCDARGQSSTPCLTGSSPQVVEAPCLMPLCHGVHSRRPSRRCVCTCTPPFLYKAVLLSCSVV